MNNTKHIVFFAPTLNRTGSEWVLLNLLKHAQLHCKLSLITKFKGEMFDQVPAGISKYFLYGDQYGGIGTKIYNKLRDLFLVNKTLSEHTNAIWYINTIVLPDILEFAESNKIKTIVHVHELQQMYEGLNAQQIKRLVQYPELIIANSNASAEVIRSYGRTGKIEIVHPSLNEKLVLKKEFAGKRAALKISKDTFVWAMCGTLDKNKDPFLFLDIAWELKKLAPKFKMIWIGAKVDDSDIDEQCARIVEERQLKEQVLFIGDVKDEFYDYFALANGFILTSQFESFSMTTLEALYLQLPIVANDCVGVKEVIGSELGYIVKQKSNPQEFAQKMLEIMKDPKVNGAKLKERALSFGIEKISAKWNTILKQII